MNYYSCSMEFWELPLPIEFDLEELEDRLEFAGDTPPPGAAPMAAVAKTSSALGLAFLAAASLASISTVWSTFVLYPLQWVHL